MPAPVVVVTDAQLAKLAPLTRAEFDKLRSPNRPKTGPYATGPWPVLLVTEIAA